MSSIARFPLRNMLLCFMLCLVFCYSVSAEDAALPKVGDLQFEQSGGKPVGEDLLRFNVRQQPGTVYDRAKLDEDIKRLYALGYFSDAVADVTPDPDGTMRVKIRLKLRPTVTEVLFDGNQKFQTEELEKLLTFTSGAPLNGSGLRDSANALRQFYADKGYLDAEIAPVLENGPDNTIRVIFRIKENLKLKVNSVSFENNTVYRSWELREDLTNHYSLLHWVPFVNFGLFDRNALEIDKVRLRDKYYDKGYLDFKVESVQVTPCADDPEFVDILFQLHEGEPYTVNSVQVTGAKSFSDEELLECVTIQPESIFDYQKENADRERILGLIHSEGFADAAISVRRDSDFSTHRTNLVFEINEGRQYNIDQVMIIGNRFTQEKVIRRELVVFPGDPADAALVDVSRARLMNMDMFENVDAKLVNADAINQKNAVFEVKEKDAYDAHIGGGFSDVDSLYGMIEAGSRNFNIADPGNWFRGGGQRLRLQAAYGIERGQLNLDFTEPWLFDIPLRLDASVYLREWNYEDWRERRWGVRTALGYKLFDDFTRATLAYKFEQVNVYDMESAMGPETKRETGREWVSQVSLELDRNTMDSLTDPKNGYQVNLLGALSPRAMGSTQDFYRVEAKGMFAKGFWDNAIVWNLGARFGVVNNFSGDNAPIYERYLIGGGDSIRGFPYRTVSSLDSTGHPSGGNGMSVFTTEISHPIWNFLRGAVFMDAGGVSEKSYNFGFDHFNIGVGYGLRIKLPQVPVPIKLDLAYPILNKQDNVASRVRFHFSMGVSF